MTIIERVPLIIIIIQLLIEKLYNPRCRIPRLVLHIPNSSHELLLQEVPGKIGEVVNPGKLLVICTPVEFPVDTYNEILVHGGVAGDGDDAGEGVERLDTHLRGRAVIICIISLNYFCFVLIEHKNDVCIV